MFEKGLALSQAEGHRWGIALSLEHLSWLALFEGQFEEAQEYLERCVAIYQKVGDQTRVAPSLDSLGQAHWLSGRFSEAQAATDQVRTYYRNVGDLHGEGEMTARLAERNITLALTDAGKETLAERGYDPVFGARPLKRLIQREIENPLARRILQGEFGDGDTVEVDAHEGGFTMRKL